MKIVSVEAIHLAIPNRYGGPAPAGPRQWPTINMLLVKVITDAGVTGWGEAFGHMACAATKAALDSLVAPLCRDADVSDIAGLGERLRRSTYLYRGGPVSFALSGIDIALWDIRGKTEGVPAWRLIGEDNTPAPEGVAAYASLLRYGDPATVARAAEDAVARGHRAVKLHEATVAAVAETRRAVGDDIALMLDVNCRWSAEEAVATAHALRPYDVAWIEEPAWPPDSGASAQITAETGIPTAAGENALTPGALGRLAEHGVAILQPSATKIGGLSGLARGAAIAEETGTTVAPHSAYFGPGLAATIHFCAGIAGRPDCEWYDCRLEANPCVGLAPSGGRIAVPSGPGLGLEIDENIVARYRVE